MKIIVGIKWVPNTQAVRFDPKTGTLIREGVPSIINPHDLDAVEFALKMKDKFNAHITAISMAPPAAIMGLQTVIGMGVDEGILASDRVFAGADTLATSYVLAKVIERIGDYDLVVFGQETIDSSTAHIGAQVASWLKLPYVYYVEELVDYDPIGKTMTFKRKLEDKIEVFRVKLPAVISVAMHSQKPRQVRMHYKIRAKLENPIRVWTNKEMGLDPRCVGLRGSPTIVGGITWTPEVPRKKEVFKGDPREAVKWLIQKLQEEGVLPF